MQPDTTMGFIGRKKANTKTNQISILGNHVCKNGIFAIKNLLSLVFGKCTVNDYVA